MGAKAEALAKQFEANEQLARTGIVFAGVPAMSSEQLVMRGLINHIDEHFGSIRKTVGG